MYQIYYHSDDYGISPNSSKRILELVREGHLDSISIIPNMHYYDECIDILKTEWRSLPIKPKISVHINLVDGIGVSSGWTSPMSWGQLFLKSFIHNNGYRAARTLITDEICEQIRRLYADIKDLPGVDGELRLDSHQHTHIVPIVFDSMLDAIKLASDRDGVAYDSKLTYIRLSSEPFWMFMTTPGVVGTFPIINLVKNIILRVLGVSAHKKLTKRGIMHGMICGLNMSGCMDGKRMALLMPKLEAYAKKRDIYMEIFGHAGIVLPEEVSPEFGESHRIFYVDANRDVEYEGMKVVCNRLAGN